MSKKHRHHDEDATDQVEQAAEHAAEAQAAGDDPAESRIAQLEREVASLDDKWKRALAEAQNARRQSRMNEMEAQFQGARRVLEQVIPVLDHVDLALGQDPSKVSIDQILGGVRLIRDELLKALANQNVTLVEPKVGDEFDPMRHEAMMRQASEEVEPGHIVQVLQGGYAMGDRVLRAAKVIIAEEGSR